MTPDPPFTADELAACLRVLQAVADDTSLADGNDRLKSLVAKINRTARRAVRKVNRSEVAAADRAAVESTEVVRSRFPAALPGPVAEPREYLRPRRCYVCKSPFTRVDAFYHLLCPDCADLNRSRREARADLRGRVALVTGGRIKIGYHVCLKMLRDGARVVVTTRFPHDAARRFAAEADYAAWSDRLELHGLDLRDLPAVEEFAAGLLSREASLDTIVHNAAQTVKRPLAFYRHLLDAEADSTAVAVRSPSPLLEAREGYAAHLVGVDRYFPAGVFDLDGQQLDARPVNSWRLKLGEIETVELLEVMLVSSVAPFVLTNRLLPAILRSPHARRFVVNVSAMEGQFGRADKTPHHPHTNMAKAALNMLTRTAAEDLARQGVYVNSVDTGWITDEKPLPQAEAARDEQGFHPPLDAIDGAARVYDPVARGVNEPGEPLYGHFLKDYAPYPW